MMTMTAERCARLQGHSVVVCGCRTPEGFLPCPEAALGVLTPVYPPEAYRRAAEPPRPALKLVHTVANGYTGNICDQCGSARMRRAGTCEVCDDCGYAGGCG
jgi:hypothetical protein